jgi:hypothetical protein
MFWKLSCAQGVYQPDSEKVDNFFYCLVLSRVLVGQGDCSTWIAGEGATCVPVCIAGEGATCIPVCIAGEGATFPDLTEGGQNFLHFRACSIAWPADIRVPQSSGVASKGGQQPGDESRSGWRGVKVRKWRKLWKWRKWRNQLHVMGRSCGAVSSWPFNRKHQERSRRCLFRSEMWIRNGEQSRIKVEKFIVKKNWRKWSRWSKWKVVKFVAVQSG